MCYVYRWTKIGIRFFRSCRCGNGKTEINKDCIRIVKITEKSVQKYHPEYHVRGMTLIPPRGYALGVKKCWATNQNLWIPINQIIKEHYQMITQDIKRTKRNLIIFIVLVLGLAVLAGAIDPFTVPPGTEPGTSGLGQLLWIVSPFGVMLLLRIFGGDGWDDFGLRPNFKGNGFWWLVSILVFPVVITITVLLGALLGGIELNVNMFSAFVATLLTGLIFIMIKNVFEEFAWRGYLAPKVYSLNMNIWLSHAIVGLVWGAWHLPFIFVFWTYLTPNMLWYFIPLLLVGTISQSVVYGEIRLATASVLPAWVMHTIGNATGNTLLLSGFIYLSPGKELWFSPGVESVISIMLMFAIGYWLHQLRKNSEQLRRRL
jgi:membrane protease YdiL (CAAX protease family)